MRLTLVNALKMVKNRVPVQKEANPSILRDKIKFGPSGRVAKNRMLKSALSDHFASYTHLNPQQTGLPTQQILNIYDKFSHGGFGIQISGNTCVHPQHLETAGNFLICKENEGDEQARAFKEMANVAKQDNTIALLQLVHAGNLTPSVINSNPSLVSGSSGNVIKEKEIKNEIVDRFVYAAEKTHSFGFDGIQIHAAYINLVAQFVSSKANKRKDNYGGSWENRLRVVEEIFQGIRQKLPASTGFIIGIKLDSVLMNNGSKESKDFIEMIKKLDELGFDFIELTGGYYEKIEKQVNEYLRPHLKQSKIYLTGGFRQTETMIQAIKNGDADGIGLGRNCTAEPDIAQKILSGEIQSAPSSYYDNDWDTMIQMSVTKMGEMGRSSWKEANQNACHGISDFSDKNEADNYHKKLPSYMKKVEEFEKKNNRPFFGCFEYK